jgi:lipopolysaccharide/colanic/teichoic acid biosynthesis glycosyltransferase
LHEAELPAVARRAARRNAWQRTFEVFSAAVGLILLSPLLVVIALAIKLNDGDAIFYAQTRVGKSFRPFKLLKFRSMVAGADRFALLTAPGDARMTTVGRVLRKCKLDELPQLFNVLKGEMQLVGPRPEVERYVHAFHADYAMLLRDLPGITDPASIAYRNEDKMFDRERMEEHYLTQILPDKLRISLEYQQRRNLPSDLRVLLRTLAPFTNEPVTGGTVHRDKPSPSKIPH